MESGTSRARVLGIVITLAVLATQAGISSALSGTTILASVNRGGSDAGNGWSSSPVISADGHVVAFASDATNLVRKDRNGAADVFARDLRKQTTSLVSVERTGQRSGNGASSIPPGAISRNGNVIAFESRASDLVPDDENAALDVFVRDLAKGTTTLASINAMGTGSGDRDSFRPTISANGRFVAFASGAEDLVDDAYTIGFGDVFVRDLKKGRTTLVSVSPNGQVSGSGRSDFPVISSNGRYVAFVSGAHNLVSLPIVHRDIFVRDLKKRVTTLVSVNRTGTAGGNLQSYEPQISANGRFVVFVSDASDLVENDTGAALPKLYVRDLARGITTVVTVNLQGIPVRTDVATSHALSGNGRFVAFESSADDLVGNDQNGRPDLFVRDLARKTTMLVNADRLGQPGGDPVDGFFAPAISADGRFIAFRSFASSLVEGDNNGANDFFLRDIKSGVTSLVSSNRSGAASGDQASGYSSPTISSSGRVVAFDSFASDLIAQPTRPGANVFVRATR